jgi:hypothetical protein
MSSESSGPPIQNYTVFSRVLVFLKVLLEGEWKSKENVILKKLTGREAQQSFLRQFGRYTRGQYPFDTPLGDGQSTLSWWMHLTRIPEGNILAVSLFVVYTIWFTHSGKDPRCQGVFRPTKLDARRAYHVGIHTDEFCAAKLSEC